MSPTVLVCAKLSGSLTRFAGADGFLALRRRTLAMHGLDILEPMGGYGALTTEDPEP